MKTESLSSISLKFDEPQFGYWDGGKKSGGVFEPILRHHDDPKQSYVKWGCYELNFWFNQPLHTKSGRLLTRGEIMRKARRFIRKRVLVPATII